MSNDYKAPFDDIRFTFDHLAGLDDVLALEHFSWLDRESVLGVIEEAGRFMAEVIAPLNGVGDQQGSRRNDDGTVTRPLETVPGTASNGRSSRRVGRGRTGAG